MYTLDGDPRHPPKKKKHEPEPGRASFQVGPRPFNVLITPDAQREYDGLPANMKAALDEIVERLKAWPEVSGVKRLFGKGYAPNKFRVKMWDWRVEFLVNSDSHEITIIRIGRRDTFYDEYH